MNKIYVVGIGPGGCDQMTGIAMNALKDSDTIIGYTVYVDQPGDFGTGTRVQRLSCEG